MISKAFFVVLMPPKRDRSPNARGGGAAAPSAITWAVLFPSLSADQKNGVARLVASLALQYHSKKEILESSEVSKAVKTFLGVSDIRIKLDTDVRPIEFAIHHFDSSFHVCTGASTRERFVVF